MKPALRTQVHLATMRLVAVIPWVARSAGLVAVSMYFHCDGRVVANHLDLVSHIHVESAAFILDVTKYHL